MMTLDEALEQIRQTVTPGPTVTVPIAEAVGCVLAQAIQSDVDVPPFDKSMMDGYAVRVADADQPREVVGVIQAGAAAPHGLAANQTFRIMTGAPVPEGADAVVMIEQAEEVPGADGPAVKVPAALRVDQNIQRRASLVAVNDVVAGVGHPIRAEDLGALLEAGGHQVTVTRPPSLAVLATGDELVDPTTVPGPQQIRNTNGPMLVALARQRGLPVLDLGIAQDEVENLRERIDQGLAADILILSGGVSAGDFDLVPRLLEEAGVQTVFHKVRVKPGKPIWFGKQAGGAIVFGLPGNPVSSLVGFRLFVQAAIDRFQARSPQGAVSARLSELFEQRGDRETLFPAWLTFLADGQAEVRPVRWRGSADLSALLSANALIRFPAGPQTFAADQVVAVYPFESVFAHRSDE
ncbi:MAG: gephyrin-like molybdotransferase Glp [Planctomycetota bacterium]